MPAPHRNLRPPTVLAGLLVLVVLLLAPGCARKYQAEKHGKEAGEALCDVRDADTAAEAKAAFTEFQSKIDDLAADYATFTAEDRADIRENVRDLAEHADNKALAQQDVTVIRRSVDNIKDDLGDAGQAAIDGLFEGIDGCANQ
jgi:hypothetical protein